MTAAVDAGGTPLLARVLDLQPGVLARALLVGDIDELSLPSCIEAMAQAASLVLPHRRLVRLCKVCLSHAAPLPAVTAHARRLDESIHVELLLASSDEVLATAVIEFADSPRPAPLMAPDPAFTAERHGRSHEGQAWQAATAASPSPPLLDWAVATGLGRVLGGLSPRGPHFGRWPSSLPFATSPAVVESLCRLAEWQWLALAGQGASVLAIESIDCYRIPRADEALLASAVCRGSDGATPCFEAVAFGSDRRAVVELHGLRLTPRPSATLPRANWQSVMRLLQPAEPAT